MEAQTLALCITHQGQLPWSGFHKETVAQCTNNNRTKDDLVPLRLDTMFMTENRGCKLTQGTEKRLIAFPKIIRIRVPALESDDAHEQLESIQISIQVLEQSKPRDCFNLNKVQLKLCDISQVQLSLIASFG